MAAGIDWMWELSIVGLVAIVALGILVGRATDGSPRPVGESAVGGRQSAAAGRVLRTAGVGVALAAILCVAVPMLAQNRLEESQAAAARGDAAAAIEAADDARAVQPWASTPYLQLALLEEQAGNLGAGEPPHRGCARARSLRLEHLARSGARADQGWFHTQGAPEPATGRAPEPQVPALRGPPGPRVQVRGR